MSIFTGAGVAIVTPMTGTGAVNYAKLEELLEFQIANKTDSIIICGTTGEASTLSHEEHLEVIRFTIEKVNKRIPVIAGTGSNCTDTAVFFLPGEGEKGAGGPLLLAPLFKKGKPAGPELWMWSGAISMSGPGPAPPPPLSLRLRTAHQSLY